MDIKSALRNPLLMIQAIILVLVPIAMASALAALNLTSNDNLVNFLSGFVALLSGGFAICQICANEISGRRCLCWSVATLVLSVLTVSQWHEERTEMIEQALGIENFDDVLLLFLLAPTLLIGLPPGGGFGLWAKRIVIVGTCAHAVSTCMDILDDLPKGSALSMLRTRNVAVDVSEMVFLELYLLGLAIYTLGEMRPRLRG
jgi:hypothetical protein